MKSILVALSLLLPTTSFALDMRKVPKPLHEGSYCKVGDIKQDTEFQWLCEFSESRNGVPLGYWSKTELSKLETSKDKQK